MKNNISRRRITPIALLLAGLVMGADYMLQPSRAEAEPPASAPATAPAQEVAVQIDNFAFSPKDLQITVGTKVTWTNKDDVPHTATSSDDPKVFDSKTIDTDDHFSFTFTKPGTYKYYCKVHPHMTGTITVK
jgi:plastocyanin